MKRNYQATFILDTRKWHEPIEALIDQIKAIVEEINGEIKSVQKLDIKPFARAPRRDFVEGHYVTLTCLAEPQFNVILQERIGLNPNVNRVIVETIEA
ncbi:MAG: 30S ribosomal protein S6 [Puniceicoccales bacterium]|jgi:ribosomal protein S6|nr:30S ribosomal protein S6 [Puniceicoccales bacterium]